MGKLKHVATRKYEVLLSDLFIRGASKQENFEKLMLFKTEFIRWAGFFDKWCYGPEVWEMGEKLLELDRKTPGFAFKVFSNIYRYGEALRNKSEQINRSDYSGKTLLELITDFEKFAAFYSLFGVSPVLWGVQKPLEEKLDKLLIGQKQEALAILTFPSKENIVNIEQRELLEIAAEVQKQGLKPAKLADLAIELRERISNHADKYGWINARGGLGALWSPERVFGRVEEALSENCAAKLRELEKTRAEHIVQSEKFLKNLGSDKELKRFVEIARELVYYRTFRTDYLNMCFANARPLIMQLAKRLDLTFEQLINCRVEEVLQQKPPSKDELARRRENFVIMGIAPNKIVFASDPLEIKELEKKYLEEETTAAGEIKGSVAFAGKATGPAKLVLNQRDLAKVSHGDIIVAIMTTPDMIVAMQKAAAFVTNEGGITCHAAIVARELNKPCIIGTKTATKAFQDGDEIEVDADKGTVKVLKRAK